MKTFVAKFSGKCWRRYKGPRLWRTTPGPTEAHKVHLGTLSCASSALGGLQWRPRLWPTAPGQTEAYESKLRTPNAPFSALDRSPGGGKQARGGGEKQGNKQEGVKNSYSWPGRRLQKKLRVAWARASRKTTNGPEESFKTISRGPEQGSKKNGLLVSQEQFLRLCH